MREIPCGGKLLAQSLGRIWGFGALARCKEPMEQEFGKRLESSESPFSLVLFSL